MGTQRQEESKFHEGGNSDKWRDEIREIEKIGREISGVMGDKGEDRHAQLNKIVPMECVGSGKGLVSRKNQEGCSGESRGFKYGVGSLAYTYDEVDVCVEKIQIRNPWDEAGTGQTTVGVKEPNTDWFILCKPEGGVATDVVYICRVRDTTDPVAKPTTISIWPECIQGTCMCVYKIGGCKSQFKPCRVIVEAMLRGDNDPDWNYVVHGACFGFNVIDQECNSTYGAENYSSIVKEGTLQKMSSRLRVEIEAEFVTVVDSPCLCIHAFGAVPKGDSDFRAIVDCSMPEGTCVNGCTDDCRSTFSYNSVGTVTDNLQSGDYMATVDIKDAYRSLNTHPSCRERQGLVWDFGKGKVYLRDNRLCMGLSSSPFVFSKVSDFVVRCLVREGHSNCVNYLDDYCVTARSEKECVAAQARLVAILRRLGFHISYKKLTHPAQVVRFLGIEIDAVNLELRLPQDKLESLKDLLMQFLKKKKATKKELERLAGLLAHACKVVRGGRTFSRRVYDMVASCKERGHKTRLNAEFRKDVMWWVEFVSTFNGKAKIIPTEAPTIAIYSDASLKGFGALHGADWLAGNFGKEGSMRTWLGHHWVTGDDEDCVTRNINVLELWPILKAVERWCGQWSNKTVVVVTDNTQVRAAINTGRSTNKTTMKWLRQIFWLSISHNFDLQSVYINTKNNVICDSLSRLDQFKNIARIRDVDKGHKMCCNGLFNC